MKLHAYVIYKMYICVPMHICTYGHTKDRALPPISILYYFTLILYFDIFD